MHHFFVQPENISGKRIIITGSDVNHIKNVLRLKIGDEISVSNGLDDKDYRCGIVSIGGDSVECELRFIKESGVELPVKVYLFQGLAKGDKFETIVQKCVELGIYEIIPVAMLRSVVRLDEKKADSRVKRYRGIAEAAAKQSRRAVIPDVRDVLEMKSAAEYAKTLDKVIVPYELASDEGFEHTRKVLNDIQPGQSVGIFIGPEGGFADDEIELLKTCNAEIISLGRRILRTETAGMTVLAWLVYLMEN